MSNLTPDMRAERIQDIDLQLLWSLGIRGLVFDLDNTITPWHQYAPNDDIISWFAMVRQAGFKVCILSNSGTEKVAKIIKWLDVPVLANSKKPRRSGFLRACKLLELDPPQLAMVGDQIFTDVFGGNRAGLLTILTEKIAEEEFWGTKNISRRLERVVKRRWQS